MADFEIIFYKTSGGVCPVRDFLDKTDVKLRAKTLRTIQLAKQFGNRLPEPYSKSLEDGIFELRTKVGSNISRVLYFFFDGGKIVLTNGFVKKTQKTPRREIDLAKRYRSDYISRKGEENV